MNRLAAETSPYLRQHADNPVDWYAWGAEAFAEAQQSDRPILLSVGYSACHWCHVMAHESFEDPTTAAIMNELFVNVKVDREERPDVDAIYMEAVQTLTGHGGWPMTVFLTPVGEPFYGGTYFPPTVRGGMPAFADVLQRIGEAWSDQRDDAVAQAAQLTEVLGRSAQLTPATQLPGADLVGQAAMSLKDLHDPEWGGFGGAPKFPQLMTLDALLRAYHQSRDEALLEMVTTSLDAMASGGIYDHLGGRVCPVLGRRSLARPSLREDALRQRPLVRVLSPGLASHRREQVPPGRRRTIAYVLRDLRHAAGGFFSAEDADSEGVEGKFYVWSRDQINAVLGENSAEFCNWFGVTEEGNFEGKNILWRPTRGDLGRAAGIELSRQRLFQAREMRIRPGLDDKVLAEWNALMLASLAEAALVTSNHQWLAAAIKNGEFLADNLRRQDGRWLRSWQSDEETSDSGEARHLAYAADLAALIDAFTRLAEASGQGRWIMLAREAADQLLNLFWDDEHGGVFTSGADAATLIARPKDLSDNALPSANSAAAAALLRLGALTGADEYNARAEQIILLLSPLAERHPNAFGHLLGAVDMGTSGFTEIVIPGEAADLLDVVRLRYLPNAVLAWGDPYDSPLWEGREQGKAYVCRNFTCGVPATSPTELVEQLPADRHR